MKALANSSKRTLLTSITTLIFFCAYGQSLKDHLQKGDRYYQRRDYGNALKNYTEALAIDGDNAQLCFKAGMSCLHELRYSEAAAFLEKAYRLQPDVDPQIHYQLATAYQADHQFAKAREHYEAFKLKYRSLASVADKKIDACILADSLMRIPSNGEVYALDSINTTFKERLPILSGDGETLLFTSNRSADDYAIKSGTNFEDVYLSRKGGETWGAPDKISPNINVRLNDAAVSLSRDGRTMFLYYDEGNGDIYTSTLEDSVWSRPEALNRFVNHPRYRETGASLSADGTRLYFSSNRPGGKGGYDIYVCERTPGGDWGRPSNLGSVINTRADEESPFIHTDGTLYFSSNGHPSIGGYDIYKSKPEGKQWTRPEHLGYPINTFGYEGDFVLSEDGTRAYFSSDRDKAGGMDIYEVRFSSGQN